MKCGCKKCDCSYYKRRVNNVHSTILPKDVWTLSNSTICSLTHLSLSLSHSHTLSSRPSVLGEYMRRSDPTLILLPLLSIIQSALLGKWKNGQKKKKRPHKQINNSRLSDSCSMEISPSHIFLIIWFYRRWGWALCSHIVYLQIIFGRMPHFFLFFFYQLYSNKAKTESLIGTVPPLHAPSRDFF